MHRFVIISVLDMTEKSGFESSPGYGDIILHVIALLLKVHKPVSLWLSGV